MSQLEKISFVPDTWTGQLKPVCQLPIIPRPPFISSDSSIIQTPIEDLQLQIRDLSHRGYIADKDTYKWNSLHSQLAHHTLTRFMEHALDVVPSSEFYRLNGDPIYLTYEVPFLAAYEELSRQTRVNEKDPDPTPPGSFHLYLKSLKRSYAEVKFWQRFTQEGWYGDFLRNVACTAKENPDIIQDSLGYSGVDEAVDQADHLGSRLSSHKWPLLFQSRDIKRDPIKGVTTLISDLSGPLTIFKDGVKKIAANDHPIPGQRFLLWAYRQNILPEPVTTLSQFVDHTFPYTSEKWSDICYQAGGNLYNIAFSLQNIELQR